MGFSRFLKTMQILNKGEASMKELLTAAYGEWPVKGLDIDPEHNFAPPKDSPRPDNGGQDIVKVGAIKNTALPENSAAAAIADIVAEMAMAGNGTFVGERRIGISTLQNIFTMSFVTALTHETTHVLQGDNMTAFNVSTSDGTQQRTWSHYANFVMDKLKDKYKRNDVSGKLGSIFLAVKSGNPYARAYLMTGTEVQARMQELLASGYQTWKRMPQTPVELWVAMDSMHITPPAAMAKIMDENPEYAEARKTFKRHIGVKTAAVDINDALGGLTREGREEFWRGGMLALYGDLITMYGDKKGMSRMFPGMENPRTEIAAKTGNKNDFKPK